MWKLTENAKLFLIFYFTFDKIIVPYLENIGDIWTSQWLTYYIKANQYDAISVLRISFENQLGYLR